MREKKKKKTVEGDVLTEMLRLRSWPRCSIPRCVLAVDGALPGGLLFPFKHAQFLKVFKIACTACGFPGCFNGAAPAAAWIDISAFDLFD